ncbi:MAG: response regulator [Candidatus Margulisiibacteriota bacterium]
MEEKRRRKKHNHFKIQNKPFRATNLISTQASLLFSVNSVEFLHMMHGKDNPVNILIIYDEPSVVESLKMIFLIKDYNVLSARNAKQGMELISPDINIIFLGFRIHDLNIINAIHEIKKLNPNIPIILFSAYENNQFIADLKNAGAYEFLCMPFMMEQAYELIYKAIDFQEKHKKEG